MTLITDEWTDLAACADLADAFYPLVVWPVLDAKAAAKAAAAETAAAAAAAAAEGLLLIDAEDDVAEGEDQQPVTAAPKLPCGMCKPSENSDGEPCGICHPLPGEQFLPARSLCGDCHTADQLERAGEAAAKKVCVRCPVIDHCLKDIVDAPLPGGQPDGVFGGLNRWERIMFMRAIDSEDDGTLAAIRALHQQLGHEGALELRGHFEAVGPSADSMKGTIPSELSVRHGVPASLARRWQQRAGVPSRRRERTIWTQSLFDLLSPGEWKPRVEIIRIVAAAVPEWRVQEKVNLTGLSEARVRSRFAQDAVRERKRYNQVEERIDDDGTRHIRLLATGTL